jgi:uncharacterized LabA/DUF88 family protein
MKVACYIDGFNLFHAIESLGEKHLQWLDLTALAQSLCRSNERLVKVAYFSAFATWLPGPYARQRQYVAALRQTGVMCHMARFNQRQVSCKSCGVSWIKHEEKETDVHVSLSLLEDAFDNIFDRAIIISADSDHAPAIRRVSVRFPEKQLFLATPPGRHHAARELLKLCGSNTPVTKGRLARCLLPDQISDEDGNTVAQRPIEYAPPQSLA